MSVGGAQCVLLSGVLAPGGLGGAHPLPLLDSSSRHRQALFHPFLLSLPHILCSGLRPGTPGESPDHDGDVVAWARSPVSSAPILPLRRPEPASPNAPLSCLLFLPQSRSALSIVHDVHVHWIECLV